MTCYYVLTDNSRFIHWENRLQLHINLNWVLLSRWHSMFIQNFCVTDQQLHALIRLGISPPSFDTGARMKYLCGPQLNQSDKDFGWAEIWTRISRLRSRRSNHYSTSFRLAALIIKLTEAGLRDQQLVAKPILWMLFVFKPTNWFKIWCTISTQTKALQSYDQNWSNEPSRNCNLRLPFIGLAPQFILSAVWK